MGMNQTPASERVHISFFGKRNAGKSSVINAVTGQDLAIVSSVMGTTTDPVYKTMELLPLGPVMVIDTPGIDDEGELGALRIRKSYQVLNKTDIAILVIDSTAGKGEEELVDTGCTDIEIAIIGTSTVNNILTGFFHVVFFHIIKIPSGQNEKNSIMVIGTTCDISSL